MILMENYTVMLNYENLDLIKISPNILDLDLNVALETLETQYRELLKELPLFNVIVTKNWTFEQKRMFTKVFYHLRGHFYRFLWIIGSYAPGTTEKKIILKNIFEEFGETRRSHELLYFDFARALQVDIEQEIITEENYVDFARKFNKEHIDWLVEHNWNEKLAAFSAYEHLDNVDYNFLLALTKSFGLEEESLLFFKVHTKVEHYQATEVFIHDIWGEDPRSIINGFHFIYNHQINMWKNLSKLISIFSKNEVKVAKEPM